ncbi:hypothetical protein AKJ48_03545 [candidate division MSBL1 archaeon SCGC-AAA261O19]|uniref:Uncharacterized protein n=3 Tax=candidate division MSBL1 TaxID=215777 RepID=A0A133V047_9EURY|nr:hypothetical protein AKJ42_02445 [candidate division MSBL1 archaeon SCGC-AAA261C02]KXB03952.1 hypothetical protein AKJ48_03545 [candidate division MSBL1 archaeon SCGC-AAA261O19]KXB09492.1 hypothetical protein AKJ46_00165 [candidate division MSBL1 archaeon SCGC-AAA833K04]
MGFRVKKTGTFLAKISINLFGVLGSKTLDHSRDDYRSLDDSTILNMKSNLNEVRYLRWE